MATSAELDILLVDDSEADALLVRRALADEGLPHRLAVVREGTQALEVLRRRLADAAAGLPDLVLLDLDLPGLDGTGVLGCIRSDERLRALPVIVLSTSDREAEVWAAYHAGANSYIRKSTDYEVFRQQMWALHLFWGGVAQRPPRWSPSTGPPET